MRCIDCEYHYNDTCNSNDLCPDISKVNDTKDIGKLLNEISVETIIQHIENDDLSYWLTAWKVDMLFAVNKEV